MLFTTQNPEAIINLPDYISVTQLHAEGTILFTHFCKQSTSFIYWLECCSVNVPVDTILLRRRSLHSSTSELCAPPRQQPQFLEKHHYSSLIFTGQITIEQTSPMRWSPQKFYVNKINHKNLFSTETFSETLFILGHFLKVV